MRLALSLTLVSGLLLAAGTNRPTIESDLAAGGFQVRQATVELIGEDGFTILGTNDQWIRYLGPDGRKVSGIKGKVIKELRWRLNEQGQFCERMYESASSEVCEQALVRIRRADGTWMNYLDGIPDPAGSYFFDRGNPTGF